MTQSREEFLANVADAYYEWEGEQLSSAPFEPDARPGSEDYNVQYVNLTGDDDSLVERIGTPDYEKPEQTSTDDLE